jgi:pilus assembly protein CpaD
MVPVNVPVVSRAHYVYDAGTYGDALALGETDRLDGWFRGLGVGYGDNIYVEGAAYTARGQVAEVASRYGLTLLGGAPATGGALRPDAVRVVVSRTEAHVPNCPNWSRWSQPNFDNTMASNYGCAVNSNIAAMVANPEDLVHGREFSGLSDARTATKPVSVYRNAVPTGTKGLMNISTKKDQ